MSTRGRGIVVLAAWVAAGLAVAAVVLGPGSPIGGAPTNLSKKPDGKRVINMTESEITSDEIGRPNSSARAAGFSIEAVSREPIAKELVWEHGFRVNLPYAWNPRTAQWLADEKRLGEIKVFTHIGFNREGRAVVSLRRVSAPEGQALEMTSVIAGEFGKDSWSQFALSIGDGNGPREGSFTSLPFAADKHARLTGSGTNAPPRRGSTNLPAPTFVTAMGRLEGKPVMLLGEAWDVNPVGTMTAKVPTSPTPLLWQSNEPTPFTGRGNVGVSMLGSTVPGVDIIIKKCPCSGGSYKLPDGQVGVISNVRMIATGAFDPQKLRAALEKR